VEKTQLWEAFQQLTPAETSDFNLWIRSPFFNARPVLVALWDYLCMCSRQQKVPATEAALKCIGKHTKTDGKTPPEQRLRIANSQLLAQMEQFWLYQEKMSDPELNAVQKVALYRKRNLPRHGQTALREARQILADSPWRNAVHYHHENLLEWEMYMQSTAEKRTEALNLQENTDLIDLVYLSRKLQLVCLIRSHEAVYKTQYRVGMLDAILQEAERWLHYPAVGLYFYCYQFLHAPDAPEANAFFSHFSALLQEHSKAMPRDEMRTLYLLAINFGIKKSNESAEGWLNATLSLYKNALENQFLIENGNLSKFAFSNIIGIALRVGEIDWAEDFVHQYTPALERQWRDTTASLALARIAYTRTQYRTALLHLQRSDYKDLIHSLTAKTLQMKIFYETSEWNLLESHLKSMHTYLRRHTSFGYHHKNFGHIIQYTRMLMQRSKDERKVPRSLYQEIAAENPLTEKEWLLKMAEKAGLE
jgi:hypothetical protein